MAATRTGSFVNIQSGLDTGSQSITVPADADCIVVIALGWSGTEINKISTGVCTINGINIPLRRSELDDPTDGNQAGAFVLAAPPTGVQTFAWNLGGANVWGDGGQWYIGFYKGVDQTTPVRSSNSGSVMNSAASLPIAYTAQSGDAIVTGGYVFPGGGNVITWTNATELFDNAFNSSGGTAAETFPTGNVTITSQHSGAGHYMSIVGVVLQAAGTGGTPISGTDTGAGADVGSLTAQIPGTQAASDSETATQTAQIPGVDAGTDAETASLGLTGSDTGTDSEVGSIGISTPDAGTDSETASSVAQISGTDAGSDAESAALRLAGSDSGVDSETATSVIQITTADTATDAEATSLVLSGAVDQGSDSEAATPKAALAGTESATGADTASTGTPLSSTDAGTATEASSLALALGAAEAASAVEVISLLAQVSVTEAGLIAEAALQSIVLSSSDAVISSDLVAQTARYALQEAGIISESAIAVQAPIVTSDSFSITESAMVSFGGGEQIPGDAVKLLLDIEIGARLSGVKISSGILLGKAQESSMLSARAATGRLTDTEVD